MQDYRTCANRSDCPMYYRFAHTAGVRLDCGKCKDYDPIPINSKERIADELSEIAENLREAETVPVVTEKAETECSDAINPSHYKQGGIECIEALKAATVNLKGIEAVCTANAIKYLWRWKEKNGTTDIRKCIWYCERLLKEIENERT